MIGQHARTTAGAARLSSFSQGLGFAIAGTGPLGAALLHQLSGGWAAPAILLAVIGGVIALAGIAVNRPWQVEDGKTRTVQDGPHQ
jgi:CP family cyanate transporter-like MFS transporter